MRVIQFMNDYKEFVMFVCLVGIFLAGVYLGKLITINNYERGNK